MEKLKQALQVDLALSMRQACRMTGWPPELIVHYAQRDGVPQVSRDLGLTRNSRPQPVTFLCRDARVAAYDGDLLRQLAGTAGLRELCGATWSEWAVRAHQGGAQVAPGVWAAVPVPDAVWRRWDHEGGLENWYIEYDAGSHVCDVLIQRMRTYAHPAQRGDIPRPQLWGAATLKRTQFLIETARAALPSEAVCIVRTIDWGGPRPHRGSVGRRLRIQPGTVTL